MKNILVLNGSPTPKGNTRALIDQFIKGAQESGNIVNVATLREMNIAPCIGCLGGDASKDSPCCQKDDMDIIYKDFRVADVVVYAAPLYWWAFPAQLKSVIDRLFATMEGETDDGTPLYLANPSVKTLMMIVPAEEDTEANFELINNYFDGYIKRLGWHDGGRLLVGGVLGHKEIQNKPEALEKAYTMGKSIK